MCLAISGELVAVREEAGLRGRLLERTARGLEHAGFRVLTHRRVPPNDGGLGFGQAAVACARDALGAAGAPAPEA